MGFDEGRIVLDSPNGAYYPGQTVHGKLIFQQTKDKTFRGIYAKLKGFCKVHWTTHKSHTVNGKTQTRTISHDSHEEYANAKTYLIGGESGEHHLKPGDHEFPFSFFLPQNCPSSFEGSYGHVRYEIKVVVDRAFKIDQEKKVAVRIYKPIDLNMDPSCKEPIEMEFNASYCCFCMRSGTTNTVINVPLSGFCSGQKIPIEVACANNGNVEIDEIKLSLTKKIKFIATSNPDERSEKDTIAKISKGPIPANTTRNFTADLEVPALDVYNLSDCRFIHISYKLKVVVSPSGCHNDSEGSRNIVIGSIPLVGFQDNIPNPLQDQLPQPVVAVTQQPQLSFTPYPDGNTFYPDGNAPYPVQNAPYPSANAPYPVENTSYPGNAPSFTGGNTPNNKIPYPGENTPAAYPAASSPYPAGNTPYPTVSPYPSEQSKSSQSYEKSPYPMPTVHPVDNSPIPDNPPPYPGSYPAQLGSSPPYPVSNTPYPSANLAYPTGTPQPMPGLGLTGLRTGTIGFRIAENSPNPNASPASEYPYATASAPPLDSPNGNN